MTGIERLREWADGYAELGKDHTTIDVVPSGMATLLADIADQIERETIPREPGDGDVGPKTLHAIALSLLDDWEREAVERERDRRLGIAADVSMSAYDLLPEEDREAIAWVREHGGLDHVRSEWRSRVPYDRYERRRQRLLGHISECETALRRRNERISELEERVRVRERANDELNEELNAMRPRLMPEGCDWEFLKLHMSNLRGFMLDVMDRLGVDKSDSDAPEIVFDVLDRRLMPEGCEWPTVDGKPVDFVTGYEPSLGVLEAVSIYSNGACEVMGHDGIIKNVKEIHVATPKVLDADGAEIRAKETVFDKNTGEELIVTGFEDGRVWCEHRMTDADALPVRGMWSPDRLTHERLVADTWERLEEDARSCTCVMEAINLVRRAKKLAGVSE